MSYTLKDKLNGIVIRARGPLEILLGAGVGVGMHYATKSDDIDFFTKATVSIPAYLACAGLILDGIISTIFWESVYKDVRANLRRNSQF